MYSSIFVNFLIYVHICSSQIVFLFPHAALTASFFLHSSLSRQVHSIKSVASFSAFLRRIYIRRTLHPLHQSVKLLSRPVYLLLLCQIFPYRLFLIIIQTSPRLIAQQQLTRGLKLFFKCFPFVFTACHMCIASTTDNLHDSSF